MIILQPYFCLFSHLSLVVRKPALCICENKDEDPVTAQLISAFVFPIRIVQSLFFLNPKLQASSHRLWLYSLVCDGPGRKPRRPVFSQRGSFNLSCSYKKCLSEEPLISTHNLGFLWRTHKKYAPIITQYFLKFKYF